MGLVQGDLSYFVKHLSRVNCAICRLLKGLCISFTDSRAQYGDVTLTAAFSLLRRLQA